MDQKNLERNGCCFKKIRKCYDGKKVEKNELDTVILKEELSDVWTILTKVKINFNDFEFQDLLKDALKINDLKQFIGKN